LTVENCEWQKDIRQEFLQKAVAPQSGKKPESDGKIVEGMANLRLLISEDGGMTYDFNFKFFISIVAGSRKMGMIRSHVLDRHVKTCGIQKQMGRFPRHFVVPKTQYTCKSSSMEGSSTDPVVIVGAGVAGLNCAVHLSRQGIPVTVVESSDGVGGRVRTDVVDGFLLDRGFQIFLTSYPEARRALDYEGLDLRPFYAGALVRYQGAFHVVADPFRHLLDGLGSLTNPIGSPIDKVLVGLYRTATLLTSVEDTLKAPETTIMECLKRQGFSDSIIDRFFRPFLGGIFFDRNLQTTSRLFNFVMRMLATGQNCLPSAGIGAVSDQLARRLSAEDIMLNTAVTSIDTSGNGHVTVSLDDGSSITAGAVVVATDAPQAQRILGSRLEAAPSTAKDPVGTCCLYFAADEAPRKGNYLYLDGDNKGGIVNNCCVPSEVSPSYAPAGKSLISVSVIGTRDELTDVELERRVRSELEDWFGKGTVALWDHLKTYRIPFAQPNQTPPTDLFKPLQLELSLIHI